MTLQYLINYSREVVFKSIVEANPDLFVAIQKFRYRNRQFRNKLVENDTDITIEGFPRSANTFSVRAFERAQNGSSCKIANHSHSYAQVIRSVKLGIPTIVLIREPRAAIESLGALTLQNTKGDFKKYISSRNIAWHIKYYIKFYSKLLPYIDNVVVAPFQQVIADFGRFIEEANSRFGKNFAVFEHTDEAQKHIFENSKHHLSPSSEREQYKEFIAELLETEECKALMEKASEVYKSWMKHVQSAK